MRRKRETAIVIGYSMKFCVKFKNLLLNSNFLMKSLQKSFLLFSPPYFSHGIHKTNASCTFSNLQSKPKVFHAHNSESTVQKFYTKLVFETLSIKKLRKPCFNVCTKHSSNVGFQNCVNVFLESGFVFTTAFSNTEIVCI